MLGAVVEDLSGVAPMASGLAETDANSKRWRSLVTQMPDEITNPSDHRNATPPVK